MAIREWSLPFLISTHVLYVDFSLPCPAEEGSGSGFGGHVAFSQGQPTTQRIEWFGFLFPEGVGGLGLCLMKTVTIRFDSARTEIELYNWLQNVLACGGWIRSLFSPTMLSALGTTTSGTGSCCICSSADTWSCCRESQDRTARL